MSYLVNLRYRLGDSLREMVYKRFGSRGVIFVDICQFFDNVNNTLCKLNCSNDQLVLKFIRLLVPPANHHGPFILRTWDRLGCLLDK